MSDSYVIGRWRSDRGKVRGSFFGPDGRTVGQSDGRTVGRWTGAKTGEVFFGRTVGRRMADGWKFLLLFRTAPEMFPCMENKEHFFEHIVMYCYEKILSHHASRIL